MSLGLRHLFLAPGLAALSLAAAAQPAATCKGTLYLTFDTEDDAVRLANDTEYGLVSYVFTQDLARGHRMIDRLETGMMGLNVGVVSNAAAPFGGVKQSGMGREGGLEGIHEYLSTKYTLIPAS